MRFTIKAKLIGGFATVIILSGAMGGIAYKKLEEMAAAQQEMALWTKRVNAIMDISDDLHTSVRAEKNALLVSGDADIERYAARALEYRKSAMKRKEELLAFAGEEGAKRLAEITQKGEQASALQAEILRLARQNSRSRANMAWQTETIPAIRNVTAATNPVIAQASGPEATRRCCERRSPSRRRASSGCGSRAAPLSRSAWRTSRIWRSRARRFRRARNSS